MTHRGPRTRLVRPFLALGLVAAMSGLATTVAAQTDVPTAAVHNHSTHLLDAPSAADIEAQTAADAFAASETCSATTGLKLPDLRMARIKDLTVAHSDSQVSFPPTEDLLRFTTVVMNIGVGPYEVKGVKDPNDSGRMLTTQKLYRTAQPSTGASNCQLRPTPAIAQWSGDGHHHWHIQRMQRFDLYGLDAQGNLVNLDVHGAKTGFCFFDGIDMRPRLPGHPKYGQFSYQGCGYSPQNSSIRMGLSIGWGDIYPAGIALQFMDITGLPNGDYRLCATVDPQGYYSESPMANNQTYTDITLSEMNQDDPHVTETGHAWAACDS